MSFRRFVLWRGSVREAAGCRVSSSPASTWRPWLGRKTDFFAFSGGSSSRERFCLGFFSRGRSRIGASGASWSASPSSASRTSNLRGPVSLSRGTELPQTHFADFPAIWSGALSVRPQSHWTMIVIRLPGGRGEWGTGTGDTKLRQCQINSIGESLLISSNGHVWESAPGSSPCHPSCDHSKSPDSPSPVDQG